MQRGATKFSSKKPRGDSITARQMIEATLQADPTINAVYCIDGIAAPAAVAVLEDMDMLDQVCIIGIDDTPEQLDLIREGKMLSHLMGASINRLIRRVSGLCSTVKMEAAPNTSITT